MAIVGLTNKEEWSDRDILGRIEISVFKGARKSDRGAGKSLDERYRIVTNNQRLKKLLSSLYGAPDANGDILTDTINVVFPFDEPERTFETAMKAYSGSGLQVVCDRSIISQEAVEERDRRGNIFMPVKPCNKPCPVAGQPMGFKCSKGCSPTGMLYFYIRELFECSLMSPCKMTLRAYSDITYISSRLEALQSEIGSITNSPFPCFRTRHKVPFTLTRSEIEIKRPVVSSKQDGYKRTGKKADGKTWAVEINPDPDYMNLLQAWKLAEEMKAREISLPSTAIAGLLGGNAEAIECIDVDVIPPQSHTLMPSTITDKERKELFRVFVNQNQWTTEAVKCLLIEKYSYTSTTEIMSTQYQQLLNDAVNYELRDRLIEHTTEF